MGCCNPGHIAIDDKRDKDSSMKKTESDIDSRLSSIDIYGLLGKEFIHLSFKLAEEKFNSEDLSQKKEKVINENLMIFENKLDLSSIFSCIENGNKLQTYFVEMDLPFHPSLYYLYTLNTNKLKDPYLDENLETKKILYENKIDNVIIQITKVISKRILMIESKTFVYLTLVKKISDDCYLTFSQSIDQTPLISEPIFIELNQSYSNIGKILYFCERTSRNSQGYCLESISSFDIHSSLGQVLMKNITIPRVRDFYNNTLSRVLVSLLTNEDQFIGIRVLDEFSQLKKYKNEFLQQYPSLTYDKIKNIVYEGLSLHSILKETLVHVDSDVKETEHIKDVHIDKMVDSIENKEYHIIPQNNLFSEKKKEEFLNEHNKSCDTNTKTISIDQKKETDLNELNEKGNVIIKNDLLISESKNNEEVNEILSSVDNPMLNKIDVKPLDNDTHQIEITNTEADSEPLSTDDILKAVLDYALKGINTKEEIKEINLINKDTESDNKITELKNIDASYFLDETKNSNTNDNNSIFPCVKESDSALLKKSEENETINNKNEIDVIYNEIENEEKLENYKIDFLESSKDLETKPSDINNKNSNNNIELELKPDEKKTEDDCIKTSSDILAEDSINKESVADSDISETSENAKKKKKKSKGKK